MSGLVLGYDLCNDYCKISAYKPEQLEPEDIVFSDDGMKNIVQTAICKKKDKDEWMLGEEAYMAALTGQGIIVDKLMRLLAKGGTATIEGKQYRAEDLLTIYLEKTLEYAYRQMGSREIDMIVFTVRELKAKVLDGIIRCADLLGIAREKVHIVSHTESYMYFVLSQKKELWSNASVLFDLTNEGLDFYEMHVIRGVRPNVVRVNRQELDEGFSLDILEHQSGQKLADSIMLSCSNRLLAKKMISSVYLGGKGLESCQDWAKTFLPSVCNKRRVFLLQNLFAKGAVYAALDFLRETSAYPYTCICEGRIQSTVSMDVVQRGSKKTLVLAKEGSNWYETHSSVDLLLDDMDTIELKILRSGEKNAKIYSIPLNHFPVRPGRTTRVQIIMAFTSEKTLTVRVIDRGFGEFFPATDAMAKQEITIA